MSLENLLVPENKCSTKQKIKRKAVKKIQQQSEGALNDQSQDVWVTMIVVDCNL